MNRREALAVSAERVPLTLGEARMVAEAMADSLPRGVVDPVYWPWVIEELCRMVEARNKALSDLVEYGLEMEDRCEGEWGYSRSLEELRTADLIDKRIIAAEELLK